MFQVTSWNTEGGQEAGLARGECIGLVALVGLEGCDESDIVEALS